jgi:hypothetical protein
MTIQELLESAQLDSLGLLDEQDREAFERAFHAAPAALQAQIRQEQARLCRVDALLPQVDLPESLWPKVREAVRMAQVQAAAEALGVVVRTHDASDRARPLPMMRAAGVHRVWRASAIGFATAALVMGAALIHVRLTGEHLQSATRENLETAKMVDTFGAEFMREQLFGKDVGRYLMAAARETQRGSAAVYTSPEWSQALLYCETSVAEGHTLRLVVLDENGKVAEQLDEFESNGILVRRKVNLQGNEPMRLALVSAARGRAASTGEIVFRMA